MIITLHIKFTMNAHNICHIKSEDYSSVLGIVWYRLNLITFVVDLKYTDLIK